MLQLWKSRNTTTWMIILVTITAPALYGANLSWESNMDQDTQGYLIHYGTQPGQYNVSIDAGNVTTFALDLQEGATYFLSITAYDSWGNESEAASEIKYDCAYTHIDGDNMKPVEFTLSQNYPNPFNPETHIVYSVEKPGHVRLAIFNTMGRIVRTLVDEYASDITGNQTVVWNGRDDNGQLAATGVYYYRLQQDEQSVTKQMSFIK